jgi:hypothetical protein
MIKVKWTLFLLAVLTVISFATVMGDLAANMKAGDWKELSTTGLTRQFLETSGYNASNHSILQYAAKAQWDDKSGQFLFLGSPHDNPYKFIIYSEQTNAWRTGPLPKSCMNMGHNSGGCLVHSYYYSSKDPAKGLFFFWTVTSVYAYNISNNSWTSVTPEITSKHYGGLSYFPETNFFVVPQGWRGNQYYDIAAGKWSSLGITLDSYHQFSLYNPVHKLVLFGGGNGNTDVFKMDTSGSVSRQSNAPNPIGTNNGTITVDPVSGMYLVIYQGSTVYEYDPVQDSWKRLSISPPSDFVNTYSPGKGYVAAPISAYGVIMFLLFSPPKVYLYKHAASSSILRNPHASPCPEITAYPNPFSSEMVISLENPGRHADISIFDITGKQVGCFKEIQNSEIKWKSEGLTSGIYFIRAKIGKRQLSRTVLYQK